MTPAPEWMETQAKVTTCRFRSADLGLMAFGIPTQRRFAITFDFYAHGRTYSGQMGSDVAMPQDTVFSIAYNAHDPQQTRRL